MPVTSLAIQSGISNCSSSFSSSISATIKPMFSPRNSSTSQILFLNKILYLTFINSEIENLFNPALVFHTQTQAEICR